MRLFAVLRNNVGSPDHKHWMGQQLYFGRGHVWGRRRHKYNYIKQYKWIWRRFGPRTIEDRSFLMDRLPPQREAEDAREVAKETFMEATEPFTLPWPYNKVGEIGSVEDPNYKVRPALYYNRRAPLWEGYRGAASFSNTVVESQTRLPSIITEWEEGLNVPGNFVDMLKSRLDWCQSGDGVLHYGPKNKVFPQLQHHLRREVGIHPIRKEYNILRSFYEISDLLVAHQFGPVNRRKILSPLCCVPFVRDGKLAILDLQTDFVTVSRDVASYGKASQPSEESGEAPKAVEPIKVKQSTLKLEAFDRQYDQTREKQLISIHPANWEINFAKTHFYSENYGSAIQANLNLHTLFITSTMFNKRPDRDRMMNGKAIMAAYGLTVAQARKRLGITDHEDTSNYDVLPEPIPLQIMFINQLKNNIGFLCFQLNTLGYDTDIKNQVWMDGPYDINDDLPIILRKLTALQLNGSGYSVPAKLREAELP